jgi:hypothetical protein
LPANGRALDDNAQKSCERPFAAPRAPMLFSIRFPAPTGNCGEFVLSEGLSAFFSPS